MPDPTLKVQWGVAQRERSSCFFIYKCISRLDENEYSTIPMFVEFNLKEGAIQNRAIFYSME